MFIIQLMLTYQTTVLQTSQYSENTSNYKLHKQHNSICLNMSLTQNGIYIKCAR